MKSNLPYILLVALGISLAAYAPPPSFDPQDPDVHLPVDGGVSYLALAGIGYAIKTTRARRAAAKALAESGKEE